MGFLANCDRIGFRLRNPPVASQEIDTFLLTLSKPPPLRKGSKDPQSDHKNRLDAAVSQNIGCWSTEYRQEEPKESLTVVVESI